MVSVRLTSTAVDRGFIGGVMISVRLALSPVDRGFIGGVMVSVRLALSAVDRGFEPRSGQTKDYTIGMCCFSANTQH